MASFLETAGQAAESLLMNWAASSPNPLGDGQPLDSITIAQTTADAFRNATPAVLRSYLLIYFVFLTSQWWIGSALGARTARLPSPLRPVANFRVPDRLIWVLLTGLALVALDQTGVLDQPGPDVLAAIGGNGVLIVAFLFGLQGIGIVSVFAGRHGRSSRTTNMMIGVILVIGLFALPWLLLIISAFGASEIWVHYRQRLQSGGLDSGENADRP